MQSNQDPSSPLERRLDMAVPVADINHDVEQRLMKLARTVKMAGFRPGKVPLRLVAQQYGPKVRSEVVADAVQRAFGEAVKEQKLRVAGYPRIEPKLGWDEGASHIEFSAVFEVYPEIRLGDISAAGIERPVLEITEAEVDKTIEVLRKQRTVFSPVDRPASDGDRVVVDFVGRLDGEVFEGGEASDFPLVLGAATMPTDFESQLKGALAGTEKSLDVTFPESYQAKHLAGKTVQFNVTLKRVEGPQLPEMDAEFARQLGIEDGDLVRMRTEVESNLRREVEKRIQARLKDRVMSLLLEANPIAVPRALVDLEAQQMAEAARRDLLGRGMDPKDMPIEPAWFSEPATRRVKLGLILAEMVKERKLEARPEQIRALVEEFSKSYEDPSEVIRWYYSQPQRLAEAEALVIERNVVEWVLANANTSDKPTSFDELMGTAA